MVQKELAQSQKKLAAEREKLRAQKKLKHLNLLELQKNQRESNTVTDILLVMNYIARLSRDIEHQILRVQEADKAVVQKRNDLVAAMKKCKTLEKLRDKEWQTHQQKLMKTECQVMDDVAAARHVRKIQSQ